MSKICEAAEQKAKELGKILTPQIRERLSTYDDETQVRWIVNPLIEFILQKCMNQQTVAPSVVTVSNTNTNNTTTITTIKPTPEPEPTPSPEPDPDSGNEEIVDFDFF